jgi:pilus assembly protein CpaE
LCARCSIAATPFQFALNRCGKGAPLSSVDVSAALQGAPVFELRDGGRDVEDYLSSGSAADLLDLKNEFAKSLEHVMSRLLPSGLIEANVHALHEGPRRTFLGRERRVDRKHGRK